MQCNCILIKVLIQLFQKLVRVWDRVPRSYNSIFAITLNNRETESVCFRFSVCVHFMVNVFGVTHLICRISSAVRKLFFAEFKKLFPSVVYFFLELLYKMFVAFLEKMFKSSLWFKEIFDRFFILWFIIKYPFTVDNLE